MSTMSPASQHVSEHILAPLRRVARRHWLLVGVRCLLQLITVGLLVLLAIALILGYMPNLTPFLRLPVVLLTWSGIVALGYFAIRPMFESWSVDRAALEIEHSLPQVQERISSAVELSSDEDVRFRASDTLIAHLIGQAEEDASNIQPQLVIRPRGILLWSLALLPVLGIWGIAALARPLTMEAGLFRVFMPWRGELPAFLARISVTPGNSVINQGAPLTITLRVSPEAGSLSDAPGQATLVKRFTSGQVLSQDLDRTGKLEFSATLANVEQGFSYRVDSAAGQTPWYTVDVRARPAITGVDLSYEYPAYTGIAPKTVSAPDGAIDAVVGTKVRITVHSTQALNERSRLTFNPGMADAAEMPLTLAEPGKTDYQVTVPVRDNGTYHFVLINTDGLQSVPDETRTITAVPDKPPTIAIVSPNTPSLSVRSDDIVPIIYKAADDFGVQKIKAMISVDDKEVGPFDLIFDPTDRRHIHGQYDLSVAYMLKQANVQTAQRIAYQFEAWDSRDPNPQTALSVKQTLLITEQAIHSYAAQLEEHDANHLIAAINQAINQLNTADPQVNQLHAADPAQPLRAEDRQAAEVTKNLLTKTAGDLTDAADDAFSTEMANVAAVAEDIASHPITDAAEDVAKAQLDADAGPQRQLDAAGATQQIADARKRLQALLDQVQKTEQRSEASRDLADAAHDQQKAAQDMAQHPDQAAKNQQEQQKADQELQQAMNEDPGLKQDQQAQTTADKLAALQQKIDDLHNQQNAQSQATAQQKPPDASKIAAAQNALNQQIQKFEKQQQNNLQQAQTTPPSADHQNQIVNDLNNNQTASAAQKMQDATNQLNAAAQKLQQASAATQPFSPREQDKINADQQAQDTAKNTQTQAEQAATALNQQTQQPGANDPSIQQAEQTAQAIQQQAKDMQPRGNDATDSRNNALQQAQQAAADAQAAQNATTPADATKDMQQAAKEIRHAADDLVQARQQNTAADQQAMQQLQAQNEQKAAAQAQALAQQQQAILQQAQPNEQAAKDEANIQQQTGQAAQDAQHLQQDAQTNQDDDVAQRTADAQQALQKATDEAKQAADAEHNNHPDQASQHEANAAHQLGLADNALRGQPPEQPQNNPDQDPNTHEAMDQQPNQNQQDPNQQAQNHEQGQNQEQGQQEQGQHQGQHPEQGQHEESAEAAHHDAAADADEAQHAQQSASNSNSPEAQKAAQEAANELAKASEKMEQSLPGEQPSNEAPHEGFSPQSKHNMGVMSKGNKPEPADLQAMGVSSRDWAKLPPLMQQDLLNAAQQNSLPAYRESIKNYFEKIARLKDQGTADQTNNE
jgi:hypothetical protein